MITKIRGLDFSASTTGGKRNHIVEAGLCDSVLRIETIQSLSDAEALGSALRVPGEWVMGIDFPFGLPLAFLDGMGWGRHWETYCRLALAMPVAEFRSMIETFRAARPEGQKQPKRHTDVLAASQSPLTTVRTPVAYMFHAGVRALLDAAVAVPPLRVSLGPSVVVEAYPALIARRLIGGNRYKDAEPREKAGAREARRTMLRRLARGDLRAEFAFDVEVTGVIEGECLDDDRGDALDSVLCAVQAACAFTRKESGWGIPAGFESEGWICDPALVRRGLGDRFEAVEEPPRVSVPNGSFNSSLTRVQPIFRPLLRSDPSGRSWVPNLLVLADRNPETAHRLADAFDGLLPETIASREAVDRDRGTSLLERCFEREFPPSKDLLRWCLDHPEALTKPRAGSSVARSVRGLRADLLSGDSERVLHAQNLGSVQLSERGPEGSSRQWWAFEGFTSVDCALEAENLILLVEGKRFESVSSSVSWVAGRNQVARNLEVARAYASARGKDFAILVIGPDGTTPPSDHELRSSWPHLATHVQDDLLNHFLGATSWRAVCQACNLDYDALPLTTADLA